jgi:hypothetical protein
VFESAEVAVWFSEEGLPSGPERLLVRRGLGQDPEVKYHRSSAPAPVPLRELAEVRAVLLHLLDGRGWGEEEIVRWSAWRRDRNRRAADSHRKRRAKRIKPRRKKQVAL